MKKDLALGVVVPVLNEATSLPRLLFRLDAAHARVPKDRVTIVIVDNGSTDDSHEIATVWAREHSWARSALEPEVGPGHARARGAAILLDEWRSNAERLPAWLVSCDADNEPGLSHLVEWCDVLSATTADVVTGSYAFPSDAVAAIPSARALLSVWIATVELAEQLVGVVNISGSNHAVRADCLAAAGGYQQPCSERFGGSTIVSGDDWDLGLRARRAGLQVSRTPITVTTSPRRFAQDPLGYLSGRAHDGVFQRVEATGRVERELPWKEAFPAVVRRALTHFVLKPVLAGLALDALAAERIGVTQQSVCALSALQGTGASAWEHSRDEFVYEMLPAHSAVVDRVAKELFDVNY